jgi:hypothetical protein
MFIYKSKLIDLKCIYKKDASNKNFLKKRDKK